MHLKTNKRTEKGACYCRPIRAAQSPQECRLQTDDPLPWTPRHASRQARQSQAAHRFNRSSRVSDADAGYLHNDSPRIPPHHIAGMKAEAQWPTTGISPILSIPQQGSQPQTFSHQIPSAVYPPQMSSPSRNQFSSQPAITFQNLPPSNQRMPESKPACMPTPAQSPSPQKQGSCCCPHPEQQLATGSEDAEDQSQHEAPQSQYPKRPITDQAERDRNSLGEMPLEPYPGMDYHDPNKYDLSSEVDVAFETNHDNFSGIMNGQLGQTTFAPTTYHVSNQNANTKFEFDHPDLGIPSDTQQNMAIPDNGCQCGSSCNCVYCTKHPTNSATRNRIGELYNIMDDRLPDNFSQESRPTSSYSNAGMMPMPFDPQLGFSNQPFIQGPRNTEPQQQGLGQQNFFEMAYPVGGCANGYCLCGDNCACVGCLLHTGHLQ